MIIRISQMLTIIYFFFSLKSLKVIIFKYDFFFLLETITFNYWTKQISMSCIQGNLDGILSLDKFLLF